MQNTKTLDTTSFELKQEIAVDGKRKVTYFSIWMSVFHMFRREIGLLLGSTLLLTTPFFGINALFHAHDMMTRGSAALTQTEIPPEQMRVLWLSLVSGDMLSFIALSLSTLLTLKYVCGDRHTGFVRFAFPEMLRTFRSVWFWLFCFLQTVIFVMINSPDGVLKIGGMLAFSSAMLLLLFSQDRACAGVSHLRWTAWLAVALIVATFPVLYILLNGVADYLILMLMDMGAAKIVDWFEPGSVTLPFFAITLSKFLSQWLNLVPMTLLLCTYRSLRRPRHPEPTEQRTAI